MQSGKYNNDGGQQVRAVPMQRGNSKEISGGTWSTGNSSKQKSTLSSWPSQHAGNPALPDKLYLHWHTNVAPKSDGAYSPPQNVFRKYPAIIRNQSSVFWIAVRGKGHWPGRTVSRAKEVISWIHSTGVGLAAPAVCVGWKCRFLCFSFYPHVAWSRARNLT